MPLPSPAEPLRQALIGQVRALFNDQAKGQAPIQRSANAYCTPDSVAWRVHGDVTTMMVGGMAALLLEMLHPAALAGVWDHSNFRRDMLGRLRNTARFIAVTTYGDRTAADAAIARVRRIHEYVQGTTPDGTPYRADDPHLLSWIHVAGAQMFLDAWVRFAEPAMSAADRDRYWTDVAPIARLLGADPVPQTQAEAAALIAKFRPELEPGPRSREIARIITTASLPSNFGPAAAPLQAMLTQAAIDLLPTWARDMHDMRASGLTRPLVDLATGGLARTLQWAFRPEARTPVKA